MRDGVAPAALPPGARGKLANAAHARGATASLNAASASNAIADATTPAAATGSAADRLLAGVETTDAPSVDGDAIRAAAAARDTANISSLLARYERGYAALDVNAVASVWPSVNRPALARAFDGLQSQRLQLERCRVAVDGATATAACHGSLQVVRGVGRVDPLEQSLQWAFHLARQGEAWVITGVRTAP